MQTLAFTAKLHHNVYSVHNIMDLAYYWLDMQICSEWKFVLKATSAELVPYEASHLAVSQKKNQQLTKQNIIDYES